MLLKYISFGFFLLFSSTFFGQSVHQTELEQHNSSGLLEATDYETAYVAPQNSNKSNCNLNKMVYGWHPYWGGNAYQNYNWDMLSHMSFFSYEVDATNGNALSTHSFSTSAAVTAALASGNTKVTLCVTLFSSHATFLGNSTSKQTLITNLINLVSARGAHGINIDFEGLPVSQKTNFANFMVSLSNQFHAAIPNSEVSTVLYAVDWNNVFDFSIMEPAVDNYIIMGYDYYYPGSTNTGPNDPLYQFGNTYNYTLSKSISYYTNAGCPKNKLVLGLPNYGFDWPTTSSTVPSSTSGNGVAKTYAVIKTNSSGNYTAANQLWDADSYTTIFSYNNGTNRQAYINDVTGFEKRLDHTLNSGIAGIGIWALGYDDGYTGYWNAIETYLTDCYQTPCTGTIHDFGGPSKNYSNYEDYTWTIAPPNAISVDFNFSSFNIEAGYDYLYVYDGPNTSSPQITGSPFSGTTGPGTFTSSSGSVTFKFTSDVSTVSSGFLGTWSCNTDIIPPSTIISPDNTWKTQDYSVSFTDADNIGISESFMNVSDNDGAQWSANSQNGYFRDDFNQSSINSFWNTTLGAWSTNGSEILQADEVSSNSNFNTDLQQNTTQLYHWKGTIGGAGANRRAGLHFFCDDITQTNRGNSYLVYWRIDSDKCQIYKCSANSIDIQTNDDVTVHANQVYDFKILFNPTTGKIQAFLDDVLSSEWVDVAPHTSGTAVSFRSGNCSMTVDDFHVYKNRTASETISVGNTNSDVRFQNANPSSPSAEVKSIVLDVANLWSPVSSLTYNVDWTIPDTLPLNDGNLVDIDTFFTANSLDANWGLSNDLNSGINDLFFAIGTSFGATDVVNFTSIGNVNSFTQNGLSLTVGQTYYTSLKIVNNAGLERILNSDGQLLQINTAALNDNGELKEISVYPIPFENIFSVVNLELNTVLRMFDMSGKEIEIKIEMSGNKHVIATLESLSTGSYLLLFENEGQLTTKLIQKK